MEIPLAGKPRADKCRGPKRGCLGECGDFKVIKDPLLGGLFQFGVEDG